VFVWTSEYKTGLANRARHLIAVGNDHEERIDDEIDGIRHVISNTDTYLEIYSHTQLVSPSSEALCKKNFDVVCLIFFWTPPW